MSSLTVASWANGGTIKRDLLDTCLVEVRKNGYSFTYSIDMQKGLIIASIARTPDSSGSSSHLYVYGEHKGIYYVRRVCCFPTSNADTTILNGGYDFYNIRINGEPVAPVNTLPSARKSRFALRSMDKSGMRAIFTGGNEPARIIVYDLAGRHRFSMVTGKGIGAVRLDQACPLGRCPGGGVIVRVQTQGSAAFSAITVR